MLNKLSSLSHQALSLYRHQSTVPSGPHTLESITESTPESIAGVWNGRLCVSSLETPPQHQVCYDELVEFQKSIKTTTAHIQSQRVESMTLGSPAKRLTPKGAEFTTDVLLQPSEVTLWMYHGLSFRVPLQLTSPDSMTHTSYFKYFILGLKLNLVCTMHLTKNTSNTQTPVHTPPAK